MMTEKQFKEAIAYCDSAMLQERFTGETINDAANIYASNYDEYCFLFDALTAYYKFSL